LTPVRRARTPWGRVPRWSLASDEELMDLRFCDLGLTIRGSVLEERIERLHGELAAKGIRFRPHVWLSTTFFTPDGIPGFAVPFYLAHPRLMRLELGQMRHIEGGTEEEFLRLARHETGHALISAYGFHRKKAWREHFGRYSEPYRVSYRPDPRSRAHVRNLDGWYAQSHPAEDFCETFAVWLRPRSNWRRRYANWRALAKLEYVDAEMKRIRGESPRVRSRERMEEVAELTTTLGEHYRRKASTYGGDIDPVDAGLRSVFAPSSPGEHAPSAAAFLKRYAARSLRAVVRLTGTDAYDVSQVLKRLVERAHDLDLVVPDWPGRTRAVRALLALEVLEMHNGRRQEFLR